MDPETQSETIISDETPTTSPKKSNQPKFLYGLIIVLVAALFGIGAYYLGSKPSSTTPSPTPAISPTVEPVSTSTESPTPTPTPTKTPKPTAKPTATPTLTPTPTPVSTSLTLNSTQALDGFESSNGGGNTGIDVRAGRNSNLTTRGFVSFDYASLPAAAIIDKVTLRIYQYNVVGSPYSVGGTLLVDHVNYGASLTNGAYSQSPLTTSIGGLTSDSSNGWKELVVTNNLKDDVTNNRGRSQYRLRFTTETIGGNVTGDFAYFESAEDYSSTGNTPQLVVLYH